MKDVSPFVEPSGHGAEAFEGVDRSLDLVSAGIPGSVEAGGPTALAAALLPMGPLDREEDRGGEEAARRQRGA